MILAPLRTLHRNSTGTSSACWRQRGGSPHRADLGEGFAASHLAAELCTKTAHLPRTVWMAQELESSKGFGQGWVQILHMLDSHPMLKCSPCAGEKYPRRYGVDFLVSYGRKTLK